MRRIHFIQFFWVTLPATVLIFTTFLVIFGDEGLFAQKRVKEQLFYLEQEAQTVIDENVALEIKVTHLRRNREQVFVLTAERLLAAPKGSVVYRFSSDGE